MMLFFFHFQIDWPVCVFICTVLLLQEVQHVGCLTNHRVFWIHLSHLLRVLSDAGHRVLFRFAAFREIHLRQLKNGLISREESLSKGIRTRDSLEGEFSQGYPSVARRVSY